MMEIPDLESVFGQELWDQIDDKTIPLLTAKWNSFQRDMKQSEANKDVDEDSEVVFPDYLQHALKGKEDKIREIEDGLENLKNIPLWLTEMNMNTGKPKLAKTPKPSKLSLAFNNQFNPDLEKVSSGLQDIKDIDQKVTTLIRTLAVRNEKSDSEKVELFRFKIESLETWASKLENENEDLLRREDRLTKELAVVKKELEKVKKESNDQMSPSRKLEKTLADLKVQNEKLANDKNELTCKLGAMKRSLIEASCKLEEQEEEANKRASLVPRMKGKHADINGNELKTMVANLTKENQSLKSCRTVEAIYTLKEIHAEELRLAKESADKLYDEFQAENSRFRREIASLRTKLGRLEASRNTPSSGLKAHNPVATQPFSSKVEIVRSPSSTPSLESTPEPVLKGKRPRPGFGKETPQKKRCVISTSVSRKQ